MARVSALQQLISDEQEPVPERPHPLLQNRLYTKVGSNHIFEVRPGILHFGGFKPGKVHREVVKVINRTNQCQSVHIIATTTPYFKVSCEKRGNVAPGMAEELVVEFCPTEWRYYYDCIRLHNSDENMVIPIHAYPTMAELFFPRRVDFGRCQLGNTYARKIKLTCSMPIQFEFRVEILTPLPEVTVEPTTGMIPPNGAAMVTVYFLPARLSTYSAQLRVSLSQFSSEPMVCTVTGSGFPDLNRPKTLDEPGTEGEPRSVAVISNSEKTLYRDTMRLAKLRRSRKAAEEKEDEMQNTYLSRSHPRPQDSEFEVGQDGLILGGNLYAHSTVAGLLNQEPGKLRVKDIKKRVQERKNQHYGRGQASDTAAATGSEVAVFEQARLSKKTKEAIFEERLEAYALRQKNVELLMRTALGHPALTEEEVGSVVETRRLDSKLATEQKKIEALQRTEPESVPSDSERATRSVLEDPFATYTPLFNPYDSDVTSMRARVLERFRAAARTVLLRLRVQKRIANIRNTLSRAGGNPDVAAQLVAVKHGVQPPRHLQPKTKFQSPTDLISDPQIVEAPLPSITGDDGLDLSEVTVPIVENPDLKTAFALRTPTRFKAMGYKEEMFNSVDLDAPPMPPTEMLQGAHEESLSMLRPAPITITSNAKSTSGAGAAPAAATAKESSNESGVGDDVVMPTFPTASPQTSITKSKDGAFMDVPPRWGVESGYLLRPEQLSFQSILDTEHSWENSVTTLCGKPTLSDLWQPSLEPWFSVPHFPPLMKGPQEEDAMSDDSDEEEGGENGGGGGGGGCEKSGCLGDVPTLDTVRETFKLPSTAEAEEGGGGGGGGGIEGRSTPRNIAIGKLDAMLREKRLESITSVLERKTAFNMLLKDSSFHVK